MAAHGENPSANGEIQRPPTGRFPWPPSVARAKKSKRGVELTCPIWAAIPTSDRRQNGRIAANRLTRAELVGGVLLGIADRTLGGSCACW